MPELLQPNTAVAHSPSHPLASCRAASPAPFPFPLSLPQVDAMVQAAVDAFGSLDVAVANAGIVKAADFLEMSEQDFDEVIRVNLKGTFLVGGFWWVLVGLAGAGGC